MQKIEQRIEKLEAKHEVEGMFEKIVIRLIRPGDMACIAEHRCIIGTGEWTRTQLIVEGAQP
jgi:hypothetical protein